MTMHNRYYCPSHPIHSFYLKLFVILISIKQFINIVADEKYREKTKTANSKNNNQKQKTNKNNNNKQQKLNLVCKN